VIFRKLLGAVMAKNGLPKLGVFREYAKSQNVKKRWVDAGNP